ncbi:8-amino-7-oxononanoate synthase [Flavobacterium sp.]|uniref:aminotransferase class I/II-fold pyridoxal phosphate-dependent enzyme n=1 Tax=Flavobacterium sp. TaxID=239 RepID=UPI00260C7638|nr:8-amino-7-oxononanoate synthase [Flavobacterium sp.]
MKALPPSLEKKLQTRTNEGALRSLPDALHLTDFASNDYLGLSKSTALHKTADNLLSKRKFYGNGATGSRLITGNHSLYREAETAIAQFHNVESALIFNSGYDANIGFFSCVPQKNDVVLYDEFIHASIRDGLRLGNATAYKFKHNDLAALEKSILQHREKAQELYIVTESVFSMDGDSPDLKQLTGIAAKYSCRIVIDEAHAVGIFGTNGEGLIQHIGLEDEVFARIVTFGKAMGCHGAAVLGVKELKEYLVNFARSLIYTTGLPPHALAKISAAYSVMLQQAEARQTLFKNVTFFKAEANRLHVSNLIPSDSAIQCVVIPGNEKVRHIAMQLQEQGYSIKPILSPTVPRGQERLRFCLHSYNTQDEISGILYSLKAIL